MFSHAKLTIAILGILIGSLQARTADVEGAPQIAFAQEFGGGALDVFDLHNGALTKKLLGLGRIQDLTYSHARGTIAFAGSRTEDGRTSLFLMTWPGAKIERIPSVSRTEAPYRPQFDADGENIYAVNYGPAIFRYSLEKHMWARIPVIGLGSLHLQGLAVSPSGNLAAISPGDFKGFLIAAVGTDQFTIVRAVLTDFDSCTSARWLDESHLVFLGRKVPGLQFLWRFDLKTGQAEQLTHQPLGTRDFLSLSNNGRRVVFTATDSGQTGWTIWSLSLDSTVPVKLLPARKDDSYLFPIWLD